MPRIVGGFVVPELSRYVITDEILGYGGMGLVVSAQDLLLDEKVAIKVIRPDLMGAES